MPGKNPKFVMSFFEIYGGKLFDLLNNKAKLSILEDKNNKVQVHGLLEREVTSEEEMLQVIEYGNSVRTTHKTHANDTSSRSHAICQVIVREGKKNIGKLLLVDLAVRSPAHSSGLRARAGHQEQQSRAPRRRRRDQQEPPRA